MCRDLAIAAGSEAASPLRCDEPRAHNENCDLAYASLLDNSINEGEHRVWPRDDQARYMSPLPATPGSLRHKFFCSQAGTGDVAQIGGKINAHNPQKIGAEFCTIRRFMALSLEADHLPRGRKAAVRIAKKLCPILNWVPPCAACRSHPIDELSARKGSRKNVVGSKAPKADVSLQARASARVYLYLP